jgi:hypothetical protein
MTIINQNKVLIANGRINLPESLNSAWIQLILVMWYLSELSGVLNISVKLWVNEQSNILITTSIIYLIGLTLLMTFFLLKSWKLNFNYICYFLLTVISNSVIVNTFELF